MLLFIAKTEECVEHLNLLAIHHVAITDLSILYSNDLIQYNLREGVGVCVCVSMYMGTWTHLFRTFSSFQKSIFSGRNYENACG